MIWKRAVFILAFAAALLTACGGPAEDEDEVSAVPEPQRTGAAVAPEPDEAEVMRLAYEAALNAVYYDHLLPDGQRLDDNYSQGGEKNLFAVCDVDLDGRNELIIEYNTGSMAGMTEAIYGYDSETGWVFEEFMQFPSLVYYDNGIIQADFSHNQGLAGRFWPYFLYKYDSDKDIYECVAMADAWDGSIHAQNYDGEPFPSDVDVSGEGIVYYLLSGEDSTLGEPVDKSEYEAWRNSYIGGAGIMDLPKVPLIPENIEEGAAGTTAMWIKQDSKAERNFYSAATDLSKAHVERFALEVRRSILEQDWQALAQYASFPLTVDSDVCADAEALIAMATERFTGEEFVNDIIAETCEEMFSRYQGISMAGGRIWIADVIAAGEREGELFVIVINTQTREK